MPQRPVFDPARLATARLTASKSQAQLARAAGLSKQAMSLYEMGSNIPGAEALAAIAQELGEPMEFFFNGGNQNSGNKAAS